MSSAKEKFYELGGFEEIDPIERLRFFCSLAMNSQDLLDVQEFFDDVIEDRDIKKDFMDL